VVNKQQSAFVVVEGLDGAGKSTAISFIKNYFEKHSIETVFTREPGGTKIAEDIRALALHNYEDENIHDDTELLLMYAGRVQHIKNLIEPALKNGKSVVSDRFYWSSMAYQGGGRKLDMSKLLAMNELFVKDYEPDLVLYLDVDPAIGLQRAKKVGDPDRIEKSGLDFFDRTRKVFKELVLNSENAHEIDASQSIESIEKEIYQTLDKFLVFKS
jgi:dTMP kinase